MKHLVILTALCTFLSKHATAAEPAKPNILISFVDDMGWAQPGGGP